MTDGVPRARVQAMKTELLAAELAPGELPESVTGWCRAFADRPGLALFDSALRHAELGRYSFLCIDPFARLEAQGGRVRLNGADMGSDPFAAADELARRYAVEPMDGLPPFRTGLAGYFGYGLRHHVEQVPAHARHDVDFPDLILGLYDLVLATDHEAGRTWLIASGYPETSEAARRDRAAARIAWARERLARARRATPRGAS
jgi:para-aminobenzoate synthetase component I